TLKGGGTADGMTTKTSGFARNSSENVRSTRPPASVTVNGASSLTTPFATARRIDKGIRKGSTAGPGGKRCNKNTVRSGSRAGIPNSLNQSMLSDAMDEATQ